MNQPAVQIIQTRRSCRSYDGRPLSEADRAELEARLAGCLQNPFGAEVRLELLESGKLAGRKLGTYGVIRAATLYIAGIAKQSPLDEEGLGFSLERAVLEAWDMGLGTCWLAGTYNRADFKEAARLAPDERIVCVTPVGYPAAKRTLLDGMMRRVAGSDGRKSWHELFFDGKPGNPLSREGAGEYADALEAVRLAPSGSNGQPWRVVMREGRFDFYFEEGGGRVNMGIAACHFELAAREAGLSGAWENLERAPAGEGKLQYFVSWVGKH